MLRVLYAMFSFGFGALSFLRYSPKLDDLMLGVSYASPNEKECN
jgi:hypothetical protein